MGYINNIILKPFELDIFVCFQRIVELKPNAFSILACSPTVQSVEGQDVEASLYFLCALYLARRLLAVWQQRRRLHSVAIPEALSLSSFQSSSESFQTKSESQLVNAAHFRRFCLLFLLPFPSFSFPSFLPFLPSFFPFLPSLPSFPSFQIK